MLTGLIYSPHHGSIPSGAARFVAAKSKDAQGVMHIMLHSPAFIPLLHGEVGILDELLLFGAPLVVVIIILAIASRRARKNAQPRERTRSPSQIVQPPNDSTDTLP